MGLYLNYTENELIWFSLLLYLNYGFNMNEFYY